MKSALWRRAAAAAAALAGQARRGGRLSQPTGRPGGLMAAGESTVLLSAPPDIGL